MAHLKPCICGATVFRLTVEHTEEVCVEKTVPCTCDNYEDEASNRTETFTYYFDAEAEIMLATEPDEAAPERTSSPPPTLELSIDLPGDCLDNNHDSDPLFDDIVCEECDDTNEPKTTVDVKREIDKLKLECPQCAMVQTVSNDAAKAIKTLINAEFQPQSYFYDPSSTGCW